MNETPELTTGPLDIQHDPDPAHEQPPARRIPHLGHAIIFFSLAVFLVQLSILIAWTIFHVTTLESEREHAFAGTLAQMIAYVILFAVAIPLFQTIWRRSFWDGIHWTWRAARLNWWKLVLLGVILSFASQFSDHFFPNAPDPETLNLFRTAVSAWTVSLLGTFLATFVEEVAFRGFLMPALATAYDWLALDRTPAGLRQWEQTASHTVPGWVFATVFSSLAFAFLHGPQIHWAWGPVAVLFAVSVVFSIVRIRLRSVAASMLVHMAYDGILFLEMCVATGGFRHLDKLT